MNEIHLNFIGYVWSISLLNIGILVNNLLSSLGRGYLRVLDTAREIYCLAGIELQSASDPSVNRVRIPVFPYSIPSATSFRFHILLICSKGMHEYIILCDSLKIIYFQCFSQSFRLKSGNRKACR